MIYTILMTVARWLIMLARKTKGDKQLVIMNRIEGEITDEMFWVGAVIKDGFLTTNICLGDSNDAIRTLLARGVNTKRFVMYNVAELKKKILDLSEIKE